MQALWRCLTHTTTRINTNIRIKLSISALLPTLTRHSTITRSPPHAIYHHIRTRNPIHIHTSTRTHTRKQSIPTLILMDKDTRTRRNLGHTVKRTCCSFCSC